MWHDMPDQRSWDDLAEWTFEFMGPLRFQAHTRVSLEHMDFVMENEQEATMFQLRCGHARRLMDDATR